MCKRLGKTIVDFLTGIMDFLAAYRLPESLDFLSSSNQQVVLFAFWLGVVVVIMALAMLVVILIMRQVMLRRQRNRLRAMAFWKNILDAPPVEAAWVPALRKREVAGFIEAWNLAHVPLHGETTPALARIAGTVGLERRLYQRLAHGGFHDRLVSTIALGHLKQQTHFDRIALYLDDKSSIVSLCAARALMQIDPRRGIPLFLAQIEQRDDWSEGTIAAILKETSPGLISRQLAQATLQAEPELASRLIRLLADVDPQEAAPIIRKFLLSATDDHLISTCLQVMTRTADLDCVRPLLGRPRWHVRMQAASTLGRLGEPGDEKLLLGMLADEQWWVRYRTAQSLIKLPSMGEAGLRELQATHTDKFARDIVDQVLAEHREIGAPT